jgi:hypothetical protein
MSSVPDPIFRRLRTFPVYSLPRISRCGSTSTSLLLADRSTCSKEADLEGAADASPGSVRHLSCASGVRSCTMSLPSCDSQSAMPDQVTV